MYLIIRKPQETNGCVVFSSGCSSSLQGFISHFTEDSNEAMKWLENGAQVYSLDKLDKIINIEATYKATYKETKSIL